MSAVVAVLAARVVLAAPAAAAVPAGRMLGGPQVLARTAVVRGPDRTIDPDRGRGRGRGTGAATSPPRGHA